MGFVRVAVYTASSSSSSHTFNFGSVPASNRIVLVVNSYAGVSEVSGDYEMHEWSSNTLGIRVYSKMSGGDSSVTVSLSDATDRFFIWMYELSDSEAYLGSSTGVTTGSASWSESDIPEGAVAILGVAQYVPPGVDNAGRSWPSGFADQGVSFRNFDDNTKQVWCSTAVNGGVSGSLSVSHKLVTGNSLTYAWAGGVWGPAADAAAPTVPGNLRLTAMTPTSVSVAWDASTDDDWVAGYGVYKNGVKQGNDQTGRTRALSGLTTGVPVTIEVDAVDLSGNRSEKASITVTPINDTTPPLTPVVKVTELTAGKISVAWEEPYDQTAISGYGIYLNGSKQGGDQTARTRTFTGLTPGGLYTVGVDAKDLLGNRSAIGTKAVRAQPDVQAPTMPGAVRVTAVTQTSVTVAWDASVDDNVGVDGYGLYVGAGRVAQVPTSSQVFTFTQLTPGITYSLGVDGVDELGNRSNVAVVSATTVDDPAGAAPPYEYVLYDWSTHEPIDSLPLQNVSFELALGGGGQLSADIPLYDAAYTVARVEAATQAERTMLLAYRGERFVWGGRIVDPTDYDSETGVLRVSTEAVVGVYGRRFVGFTGPRTGTLAHSEMDWLLDEASAAADRQWLRTDGVPGTVLTDREYRAEEFSRVLDTAAEVAAAPGGFEWWEKPAWDQLADRPQMELRRVNRDDPPTSELALEYPGNVRKYRRSTRRGLATVTFGKLSLPDGGVLIEKVERNDLHVLGYPKLEDAHTFERLTSPQALKDETERAADAARGSRMVFEFELSPGQDVRWWEWELGSLAQVVITDWLYPEQPDGSAGLDRPMKIISVRVTPSSDGGELVTVTTAEMTTAVDEDE